MSKEINCKEKYAVEIQYWHQRTKYADMYILRGPIGYLRADVRSYESIRALEYEVSLCEKEIESGVKKVV